MDSFATNLTTEDDMAVLCILSHGYMDHILGSDGVINLKTVQLREAAQLVSKAKINFFLKRAFPMRIAQLA